MAARPVVAWVFGPNKASVAVNVHKMLSIAEARELAAKLIARADWAQLAAEEYDDAGPSYGAVD